MSHRVKENIVTMTTGEWYNYPTFQDESFLLKNSIVLLFCRKALFKEMPLYSWSNMKSQLSALSRYMH